ncbi:hypothetical protein A9K55_008722 [Cordyceps militaris]|uniref:Uncharacterized protein n=1 Tax=Cordyceps militaris TaxID=73501 RepID=A0A2H4SE84_CORMI|nr:hypothetical protein A9K55_008722 [Cordyceps militaris]
MFYAQRLTTTATRSRAVQRALVRRISSEPGGPKPAESSTAPKLPGWQIAAVAGVAVAGVYAMFIARPDAVAKSSVPTNQTKNPSQSRDETRK